MVKIAPQSLSSKERAKIVVSALNCIFLRFRFLFFVLKYSVNLNLKSKFIMRTSTLRVKLLRALIPVFGMFLLVTSCTKDAAITTLNETTEDFTFAKKVEETAHSLSNLIAEDATWRNFVINRALKSENGDQVFLYALAKDEKIAATTFADALAERASTSFESKAAAKTFFNEELLQSTPLLSIAFNVADDQLNPNQLKEGVPTAIDKNVTTVFYDFQDNDNYLATQEIPHFINGSVETITYDQIDKAGTNYLIVRNNERAVMYDTNSETLLNDQTYMNEFLKEENNADFFFSAEALMGTYANVEYRMSAPIGEVSDDEINSIDSNAASKSCKDGNVSIPYIYYTNDKEGAFRGGPEVRGRIVRGRTTGNELTNTIARNYGRGNERRLLSLNWDVFYWDDALFGTHISSAWHEEDGGSGNDRFTGSFTTTIKGDDYGFSFDFGRNKDDLWGDNDPYYCNSTRWYGVGSLSYYFVKR